MTINRPQDTDRRTVLKTIGTAIVGAVTMTESAVAHEPKGGGKAPVELTWGSDRDEWELLTGNFPTPSDEESHAPLYIIAPVVDSEGNYLSHNGEAQGNTEHGGVTPSPFDEHDHVVPTPGSKKFNANWHTKVVYESNEKDPAQYVGRPPTASEIEADASAGNVVIEDAPNPIDPGEPFVFTCPIRPH